MDWFSAGGNGPLIVVRAIHFAATSITAGSLIFATLVARPVLRSEETEAREQTRRVAGIGLAIAAASGVIWFLFQAVSMSGLPLDEAMKPSVLSTVLNQTQFGQVSEIRIGLAIVVAACLAYHRLPMADWLGLAAAFGLTIGLAWSGHAGSTLGDMGILHLTADGLHLVAAAAWIGGLVSLVLLLARVRRNPTVASASLARHAVGRFSALGIVSVATLLATGTVNAWILVGSFHALVGTEYGRLLMIKMVAFAVMLAFAAFNRLWLTPRFVLSSGNESWFAALHQIARNSTIEIALGIVIFAIVGLLGTLHPAIHLL